MKIEGIKAWAVIKGGKYVEVSRTREAARELKARLGGKDNGVSIIQLVGKGEVRQNDKEQHKELQLSVLQYSWSNLHYTEADG